jgi:hypothetical protein
VREVMAQNKFDQGEINDDFNTRLADNLDNINI